MRHDTARAGVGAARPNGSALNVCAAAWLCPWLRSPPGCRRPANRDSAAGAAAVSPASSATLPVFAGANRAPAQLRSGRCRRAMACAVGTYHCLLGLLSVTGMRIGEAIRLQLDDVNLQDGLLTLRGTKFGKSRLVPIHPSTQEVLAQYRARRERCAAGTTAPRSSSSRVADITWTSVISIEPSTRSRARSVCALPARATGRACMTSVIDSHSRRCCDGTARARMPSDACPCSQLTSDTSMSPIPTGISVAVRN